MVIAIVSRVAVVWRGVCLATLALWRGIKLLFFCGAGRTKTIACCFDSYKCKARLLMPFAAKSQSAFCTYYLGGNAFVAAEFYTDLIRTLNLRNINFCVSVSPSTSRPAPRLLELPHA